MAAQGKILNLITMEIASSIELFNGMLASRQVCVLTEIKFRRV
jgi:hypothetical protein